MIKAFEKKSCMDMSMVIPKKWETNLSIKVLIDMVQSCFNSEKYTNRYTWNRLVASRFIESILIGLPISSMCFVKNNNDFVIIDGYQRMRTLHEYISTEFVSNKSREFFLNTYGVSKHWMGKSFLNLSATERVHLLQTTIHIIIFETNNLEDLSNLMIRYQEKESN